MPNASLSPAHPHKEIPVLPQSASRYALCLVAWLTAVLHAPHVEECDAPVVQECLDLLLSSSRHRDAAVSLACLYHTHTEGRYLS
jgi:hypothetical protein